jgi:dolichol-phosphate mannosyltransferase
MDGPRLSLVLPAFNEEAGIRQAVAEADDALARLCGEYEILVVDDGSRDRTAAEAAAEARDRPHVRVLRHPANRGYGAALRTGFEAARFDRVAFTDADCQFHLDDLALLLPHTRTAPVVVGRRTDRQDPWRRRFLSGGYNLLTRTLLGTAVRDCDCALKVFRQDALARLLPESTGFFVNAEMLSRARMLGLAVAEVGVRHRPRLKGQSTVSLREVPRTLGRMLPYWWSRLLFAGPAGRRDDRPAGQGGGWALLLVVLVAGLLFFTRLRAPLLEPQEARYAEIARQMLAEGRLVVPVLHGQPYLDKPPLLYWLVMGSYSLFGAHDWAARLVPGLAGLLTVLVTFLWGRRAFGARAGLCGALVLCLAPGFVYRARMLTFDTLLASCVAAALAAAHVALGGGRLRWGWWLASAAACGLGLLTKGPVALALLAGPLLLLPLLDPRLARPGVAGWAAYLAVALGVSGPWYAAAVWAAPEFAGHFFWRHNVVRFVAPFDHAGPVWFYLPGLLAGMAPWTLLLPGLALLLARRGARSAARRPGSLGFVLASFAWMLLFFSAAGCKRPTYVLPALPPLALALGWYVGLCAPSWRLLCRRGSRLASAAAVLALAGALGVALTATALAVVKPHAGLTLAGLAAAALAGLALWPGRVSWLAGAAVVFVCLFGAVQHLQPAYNRQFALRGPLRRHTTPAELRQRPVVCYPQRFDSVSFYLPASRVRTFGPGQRRDLIAHLQQHPGTLLLVKSGPVLEQLLRDLPPDVCFTTRQRGGAVTVGRVVRRAAGPGGFARAGEGSRQP